MPHLINLGRFQILQNLNFGQKKVNKLVIIYNKKMIAKINKNNQINK